MPGCDSQPRGGESRYCSAILRSQQFFDQAGAIAVGEHPESIQAASIHEQLHVFPADAAFSVRSSSTFEDLASAAFASQHDTFLNVIGATAVVERVRERFAWVQSLPMEWSRDLDRYLLGIGESWPSRSPARTCRASGTTC